MVNKSGWCATTALLLLCCQPSLAVKNMRLYGALVAEPCVILPGDETVVLDFDTVIDKYLYMNTRTNGKAFELRLAQCDLSMGEKVKVTFSGDESIALPGLLALNGTSVASGIAIGMETPQGELLPINVPGKAQKLVSGANILTVHAFVKGEPEALAQRTIGRGTFNAQATISLEYE
ncbi:fimbrial protein [Serratia fonticola]|uniref:fimbrial protein n=1 Tax=Serratia fonticola TaxID=47917 RepID=UPI0021ADFB98|nr:fimbrial protein [Serratia fonticola]